MAGFAPSEPIPHQISRGSCTTIPCHQQRAAVSPRLCKRTSLKPIPQESTLTIFLGGYEGVSQVYIANPAFSYAPPPPSSWAPALEADLQQQVNMPLLCFLQSASYSAELIRVRLRCLHFLQAIAHSKKCGSRSDQGCRGGGLPTVLGQNLFASSTSK